MTAQQKNILGTLLLLLSLVACTGHTDTVRLRGEISHLDQGEFLLYSSDGVLEGVDSLHVRDGRFQTEVRIQAPGTLHILYPNFSQLTLFVRGGEDLRIDGDARKLSEVTVKGSDDNELYTDFRQDILGKSDRETQAIAYAHALAHPQSAMARYLLQTYFLQREDAEPAQVEALYDSLLRANPDNVHLSRMAMRVNSYHLLEVGRTLPHFSLRMRPTECTKDRTDSIVSDTTLRGKYLLMFFWATWKGDARNSLYYARQHRIKSGMKEQNILAYSLDTDETELQDIEKRDTVTYLSYCDHKAFSSPLVQQWGITQLPFYLYVSPQGEILAAGNDWKKDIEPLVKRHSWENK